MPKAATLDGGTFESPTLLGNKHLKFGFDDSFDGSDVFSFRAGAASTVTLTSSDAMATWNVTGDAFPDLGEPMVDANGVFTWTVSLVDFDGDGVIAFGVDAQLAGSNYSLSFG
jgi:hypothetical protein